MQGHTLDSSSWIIEIDSLYPADLKKCLEAYSGLIDILVNFYDKEARCAFVTYAGFLIKIMSTSQTAESGS